MSFSLLNSYTSRFSAKREENAIKIEWLAACRNFKQDFKRQSRLR
jgi:hypothetical protein